MQIARPAKLIVSTAFAAAAIGCGGGDERLSDEEYTAKMQPIVERISGEFGAVFEEVGRRGEDEAVPAAAKDALRKAAEVERSEADKAADLEPPENAEGAGERLAEGARAQADKLERMAGDPDLTVRELADAIETGPTTDALKELAQLGYVEPPGHQP